MITLGGVAIIASVIAIVLLIVGVTVPLFRSPAAEILNRAPLPAPLRADAVAMLGVELVEVDERIGGDVLSVYALARDGTLSFLKADESAAAAGGEVAWRLFEQLPVRPSDSESAGRVVAARRSVGSSYTLLWDDGSVSLIEVGLAAEFDEKGHRTVRPSVDTLERFSALPGPKPVEAVAVRSAEGTATCARLLPGNRISVVRRVATRDLLGNTQMSTNRLTIAEDTPGPIRTLTLKGDGSTLFGGTDDGVLARWRFDDPLTSYEYEPFPAFRDGRAITALAMVYGDVSLAVGDAEGGLSTWTGVRYGDSGDKKLRMIHRLRAHRQPVVDVVPSERDMSLMSLGRGGPVHLDFVTSEKPLLSLAAGGEPLAMAGYSSRGNAAVSFAADDLVVWQIDNPHPEVSWRTLFGKVHYDNHDEPKYLWQSSGTHEPKFSLVPVIFGTFKATAYAMLFAVPLALCGAMYVSYFTTPGFKKAIKPVVEIMAAVPSVVVGFLVLLWLAPRFGDWIVAVFASFFTIPATFVAFMLLWQFLRRFDLAKRVETGYEFAVVTLCVIAPGVALAWAVAGPIEAAFFGGDFRQWLAGALATPYEQLNSIVVAFGLGFAVIPIIFSISEDALSGIPHSLSAASLAMGASRWQTAWRVVLPSASPAIFAAVMIGFGRAVGETMIVFMATGNTPILDWSPLNGFRTLSANIAVEISEAPKDGTLYRILFLCAVLLFVLTFVLNTAAELVRQHLRKKFGQY